ncbi:hypothetical protein PC129_g9204 [Phytophthora cactorum]|uniref:Uncharacterized protein n=1 Tax=Phytophthora cactorum TaxID=29920 RepID=A0A329SA81_9STRA|nr:hypothetical protein PC115_g9647 [Phytophthora cactorum]KAG2968572.1 hypothetical protein PC118_g17938 [Phytophthora cactorum]KAG3022668.1 hypothetical protein PC119_g9169 [Phytophthora cactorum]KAG3084325.1 hypothetical protein PC122_g10181 [Phytophthora cactorum]KAG3220026.1 hypothetical protein PC129_g9204 [Phytophthora cactorum]
MGQVEGRRRVAASFCVWGWNGQPQGEVVVGESERDHDGGRGRNAATPVGHAAEETVSVRMSNGVVELGYGGNRDLSVAPKPHFCESRRRVQNIHSRHICRIF